MRFLKKKIAMAQEIIEKNLPLQIIKNSFDSRVDDAATQDSSSTQSEKPQKSKPKTRLSRNTPHGSTSCKNIMKNYSRALTRFALSKLASPYLIDMIKQENVTLEDFHRYIKQHRSKVHCIKSLRELLLLEDTDSNQVASYKKIFQRSSEVFLKFFSVNWIFSSRVDDKITHLKYRFKILRRIKNPAHFTYLQSFTKI